MSQHADDELMTRSALSARDVEVVVRAAGVPAMRATTRVAMCSRVGDLIHVVGVVPVARGDDGEDRKRTYRWHAQIMDEAHH